MNAAGPAAAPASPPAAKPLPPVAHESTAHESVAHDHAHPAAHSPSRAHRHPALGASALAGGLGRRIAIAAAAVALLWLTIGWALA